jgi:uncharacterized protein YyaL (SSP411 family)
MTNITWRPWSDEAFTDAQRQNKPVLLFLTAPWCQFCTAMDEQTYGNEAIAQYANANFITVRVDTDKRPDINTRYGQGGWPSTAILTPEGDVLWGGTFLPADQMAQLLPQVKNQFDNNKPGVAQHVNQLREQIRQQNTPPPLNTSLEVTADIPHGILLGIKHNFDFAFGGFGHAGSKFPHTDALELVLAEYTRSVLEGEPDVDLKFMIDRTLLGMAQGSLHDQVSGGFFRYTQTPDWRDPQVEKLLEDSATIAIAFIHGYQITGDERWKEVAEKTLNYLQTALYDNESGTWGGSQYADAEYYAQPVEERAEWNPPSVDPTVYAGANAMAVRAHIAWWRATGDTESLRIAKRGLDAIIRDLVGADGAIDHFIPDPDAEENFTGRVPTGLLGDSSDVTAACLDLYEAGQGVEYLDRAEEIAAWVRGHLEDPRGGGLYDSVISPSAIGNLKVPAKDPGDNLHMAETLLRLFLATGDEDHAHLAQRVLQAFLPVLQNLGFFGASFALAAERAILPPFIIHVLGSAGDAKFRALLAAAQSAYRFERFVQPLDPSNEDDGHHISELGYDTKNLPVAFINIGLRRLDPVTDPAKLIELTKTAV